MGHRFSAKWGSEPVKTIGSFAGYFLEMCPPRETTVQVKPKVLDTGRPVEGSIIYVESVGEPSACEKDYSCREHKKRLYNGELTEVTLLLDNPLIRENIQEAFNLV